MSLFWSSIIGVFKYTSKYPIKIIQNTLNAVDNYGHSWTYWAGIPDNNTILRELSRTYAMIVGGTIKNMKFNSDTSEYNLEYFSNGNKTIIYINRELYYPDGYILSVEPKDIKYKDR